MPEYCELETDVTCPSCGARTPLPGGVVRFQWGEVPCRYRPGEPVRWLHDENGGIVPPFRVVISRGRLGRGTRARFNFGDPAVRSLLAFDTDVNEPGFACARCSTPFTAVAAHVDDAVVTGAQAFTSDSLTERFGAPSPPAAIVVIGTDRSLRPRPEWDDPDFHELSTTPPEDRHPT